MFSCTATYILSNVYTCTRTTWHSFLLNITIDIIMLLVTICLANDGEELVMLINKGWHDLLHE